MSTSLQIFVIYIYIIISLCLFKQLFSCGHTYIDTNIYIWHNSQANKPLGGGLAIIFQPSSKLHPNLGQRLSINMNHFSRNPPYFTLFNLHYCSQTLQHFPKTSGNLSILIPAFSKASRLHQATRPFFFFGDSNGKGTSLHLESLRAPIARQLGVDGAEAWSPPGDPNLNLHLPLASWEGGQPNEYMWI